MIIIQPVSTKQLTLLQHSRSSVLNLKVPSLKQRMPKDDDWITTAEFFTLEISLEMFTVKTISTLKEPKVALI